jgi:hypothetical protein
VLPAGTITILRALPRRLTARITTTNPPLILRTRARRPATYTAPTNVTITIIMIMGITIMGIPAPHRAQLMPATVTLNSMTKGAATWRAMPPTSAARAN